MRLPSLDRLASSATATLRRFPVVLAMAAAATVAALVLVEGEGSQELWVRHLAAATLGLPLTFAVTMAAERWSWDGGRRAAAFGLALLVLAAVHLAWPAWSEEVAGRRYLQLSAGFHLLAAFLPFVAVDEARGFWQYNRALFLRFLTAALYVAVLQAGLSLAMGALDQLFGVPIPELAYLRLGIVLALLFQTWFFLGGVPEDLRALDSSTDHPRGLRLFTQYVLVPLVVVYLVILTAYAGKVLLTWDWPGGWIGWLVSTVAVAGILAYLLVHPIRGEAGNRWVRVYGRWFWVALLPSVVLLALAAGQRIAQYGVTEDRYFLAVGAGWLGAVALYYALSRSEDIERIPQTLCVVVLATLLGPWSAYSVSERSQLGRLRSLLAANEMLVEGRARPAPGEVSFEDRREISATVRYLVGRHGEGSLAPLFGGEPPGAADARTPPASGRADTVSRTAARGAPERIVASLGMDYVHRWEGARSHHFAFRSADPVATRRIAGYDHLVRGVRQGLRDTLAVDGGVRLVTDSAAVRLLRDGRPTLELSVLRLAERLRSEGRDTGEPVPADTMWVEGAVDGLAAALWLESITARRERGAEGIRLLRWRGVLLVGGTARE